MKKKKPIATNHKNKIHISKEAVAEFQEGEGGLVAEGKGEEVVSVAGREGKGGHNCSGWEEGRRSQTTVEGKEEGGCDRGRRKKKKKEERRRGVGSGEMEEKKLKKKKEIDKERGGIT